LPYGFSGGFRRYGMEIFYWVGGIIAAGLLIYLLIALLKPEIFS
jgi:K+-transporting ATPase KdpF subunit